MHGKLKVSMVAEVKMLPAAATYLRGDLKKTRPGYISRKNEIKIRRNCAIKKACFTPIFSTMKTHCTYINNATKILQLKYTHKYIHYHLKVWGQKEFIFLLGNDKQNWSKVTVKTFIIELKDFW